MNALAARMTRYRNKLEGRSGTLWKSRYKSSIVQSDTYLLASGGAAVVKSGEDFVLERSLAVSVAGTSVSSGNALPVR